MAKPKVGINVDIHNIGNLMVSENDLQNLIDRINSFFHEIHFANSGPIRRKHIGRSTDIYMNFSFDGRDPKEWKIGGRDV
jgi:hypothetical protein